MQQQVDLQFGVNVSTVERLVRGLRDTRRVADRPRRGRPRIMTDLVNIILDVLFAFYHFLYVT
jgi:transposase